MANTKILLDKIVSQYKGLVEYNPNYDKFIKDNRFIDIIDNEYLFYFKKDWQFGELDEKGSLKRTVKINLRPRAIKRYMNKEKLGFPFLAEDLEPFIKSLHYTLMDIIKFRMKHIKYNRISKDFKKRLLKNFRQLAKSIQLLNIETPKAIINA